MPSKKPVLCVEDSWVNTDEGMCIRCVYPYEIRSNGRCGIPRVLQLH